jgi:hypothetical protein
MSGWIVVGAVAGGVLVLAAGTGTWFVAWHFLYGPRRRGDRVRISVLREQLDKARAREQEALDKLADSQRRENSATSLLGYLTDLDRPFLAEFIRPYPADAIPDYPTGSRDGTPGADEVERWLHDTTEQGGQP